MSYPVDLDIPSEVGTPSVESKIGTKIGNQNGTQMQALTEPGTASHPEKPAADFSTKLVTS